MIAKIKLISNQKEVEAAIKENQEIEAHNSTIEVGDYTDRKSLVEVPSLEYAETEMAFSMNDVDYAYLGNDNMINIEHKKNAFKIIYEPDVWERITEYLKAKESIQLG